MDRPNKTEDTAEPSGPAAVETKILELSEISVEVGGVGEGVYSHCSTFLSYFLPFYLSVFHTQISILRRYHRRIFLVSRWHM